MDITRPSIEQIEAILNACSGKQMWGVLVSEMGLSFEIGRDWKHPRTGELHGRITVFVRCAWEIYRGSSLLADSEMEENAGKSNNVQSLLEGKIIRRVTLDRKTHRLEICSDVEERIVITPPRREDKYESWTMFHVVLPEARYSCTFDGAKVYYNE